MTLEFSMGSLSGILKICPDIYEQKAFWQNKSPDLLRRGEKHNRAWKAGKWCLLFILVKKCYM